MQTLLIPLFAPVALWSARAERRQAYRLAKLVAFRRRRGVPAAWTSKPGACRSALRLLRWLGR